MNSKKELSPFAQAALDLDADFQAIEETSGQLARLDVQSDAGLKRGKILLTRFSECGQRIGTNIQILSGALNEAQVRASQSAKAVTDKANEIQQRQTQTDQLHQRFQLMSETLKKFNEAVSQIRVLSKEGASEEGRRFMVEQLPTLTSKLGELIEEVARIEAEAKAGNLKALQKDANALGQSMQSMRRKLESIATRFAH